MGSFDIEKRIMISWTSFIYISFGPVIAAPSMYSFYYVKVYCYNPMLISGQKFHPLSLISQKKSGFKYDESLKGKISTAEFFEKKHDFLNSQEKICSYSDFQVQS